MPDNKTHLLKLYPRTKRLSRTSCTREESIEIKISSQERNLIENIYNQKPRAPRREITLVIIDQDEEDIISYLPIGNILEIKDHITQILTSYKAQESTSNT